MLTHDTPQSPESSPVVGCRFQKAIYCFNAAHTTCQSHYSGWHSNFTGVGDRLWVRPGHWERCPEGRQQEPQWVGRSQTRQQKERQAERRRIKFAFAPLCVASALASGIESNGDDRRPPVSTGGCTIQGERADVERHLVLGRYLGRISQYQNIVIPQLKATYRHLTIFSISGDRRQGINPFSEAH